jgi:putative addiction module component (TIGR02574 family)
MSRVPGESVVDCAEALLLTSAQRDELERRWRAFEQHPDEGEPWEDVKRSLLEECPTKSEPPAEDYNLGSE